MATGKAVMDYDAVVVGSGPNGLAAAITLQRSGARVLLVDARSTIGGGMRSAELTLPGFLHDVCSAIHPMAAASPFMQSVPLKEFGLTLIQPTLPCVHPLDGGAAVGLYRSIKQTTETLGAKDAAAYEKIFAPFVEQWPGLVGDLLGPPGIPKHPVAFARFGLQAMRSARMFAHHFRGDRARAFFAGMSAHSFLPLNAFTSAAIGIVLTVVGHTAGWPIAKGGSESIANALRDYFVSLGGTVETNFEVSRLKQLPSSRVVLFDVTPAQLLRIMGDELSPIYRNQLSRYRYGMGVFKVDWALSEAVPFTAPECRLAGTVHLGGTLEEISQSEEDATHGRCADKPFVLFAQQSVFDSSRAPLGKQTAWAYCHVPNGSAVDMTEQIERQVERFAPGFRDTILAKHTWNTQQMEAYNPNFVGGDINGGRIDLTQLFTRPALRISPYRTSMRNVYLCSSSTPPGGGVHGMCGYHAAKQAIHDHFPDLTLASS